MDKGDVPCCDYSGCSKPVRPEDMSLSDGGRKYCEAHGAEIDTLLRDGKPADILRWWANSMRQPEKAVRG